MHEFTIDGPAVNTDSARRRLGVVFEQHVFEKMIFSPARWLGVKKKAHCGLGCVGRAQL